MRESNQNGENLRTATYTANNLNQYTQRTVPGYVDIMGLAFATNTVAVNGQTAYRKSEYFRDQYAVNNSSSALWTNITVTETNQYTTTGNLYVPKTPETFAYDADGNLTTDGRWTYTWGLAREIRPRGVRTLCTPRPAGEVSFKQAPGVISRAEENRLISMTTNTSAGPPLVLTFGYDWQGRRTKKQVSYNGAVTNNTTFAYDGWNPIGRPNAPNNNSLVQSYLWGLDLSGSAQGLPRESGTSLTGGAGGVGGLLEVNDVASSAQYFPAYDGNGNLAALIQASSGTNFATYEYGPFGELLRATGPMARANPLRFSTKYQDDETDLLYYGHRYYTSSPGRWLSPDPIVEAGGPNLYAFVANGMGIDPLGQVRLNYINYPQREPNAETLFAGHYWTFDATDAHAFSSTNLGAQQFYEGVMLWHHTSKATITDCSTGVTLSDQSRDLYFYEKFMLDPRGNVFAINDQDAFDNGHGGKEQHPFIETATATMQTIFLQSPGFTFGSSGTGRPTKGHFETTLEVHFDPSGDYDWARNFEPLSMSGYREIDGHDMLRNYNGYTVGMPSSWQISPYYSEYIHISFDWNNCCGKRSWHYSSSPALTSAGETRWRYSPNNPDHAPTYPNAINLLAQPRSAN